MKGGVRTLSWCNLWRLGGGSLVTKKTSPSIFDPDQCSCDYCNDKHAQPDDEPNLFVLGYLQGISRCGSLMAK